MRHAKWTFKPAWMAIQEHVDMREKSTPRAPPDPRQILGVPSVSERRVARFASYSTVGSRSMRTARFRRSKR